jgi:hypothetical protein
MRDHETLLSIWKLILPGLLGASALQLSLQCDRLIAGFIGDSAAASLYFSERLVYLPVGIFAVSFATVANTELSRFAAAGHYDDLTAMLMKTIRILDTAFDHGEMQTLIRLEYFHNGDIYIAKGIGTGPLDAAQAALEDELGIHIRIKDYSEHSLTEGSAAEAVSYIELQDQESNKTAFGVGRSSNTMVAQMRALFSAVNRLQLVR